MSTTSNQQVITSGTAHQSPGMDNALARAVAFPSGQQQRRVTGLMAHYSATVSATKTITLYRGGATDQGGHAADAFVGLQSNPTFVVGTSDDTKVRASVAWQYSMQDSTGKAVSFGAAPAEYVLAAGTIPADTWGIYRFTITAAATLNPGTDGTVTVTPGAANFTTGYASEALAIAALPAVAGLTAVPYATSVDMGYATILTNSGNPFIGGTDSPQGGASGNVSADTNYYPGGNAVFATTIAPTGGWNGRPITYEWDFTNGNMILPMPGIISGEPGDTISAELEESGTGGTVGTISLFTFTE